MENAALVAQLYQAANKMEKVSLAERRRLLEQAVDTIGTLRERASRIDARLSDTSDLLREIRSLISGANAIETGRFASTLLACAEVIRSLSIFIASQG